MIIRIPASEVDKLSEQHSYARTSQLNNCLSYDPIYFQRILNPARVEKIYKKMLNYYMLTDSTPETHGVFEITVSQPSGKYFLLDGNHRFHIYNKLLEVTKGKLDIVVSCTWRISYDTKKIEERFRRINQSTPVAQMPSGVTLSIPNKVISYIKKEYPGKKNRAGVFAEARPAKVGFLNELELCEKIGTQIKKIECERKITIDWEDYKFRLEKTIHAIMEFTPIQYVNANNKKDNLDKVIKRRDKFSHMFWPALVRDYAWLNFLFCPKIEDYIKKQKCIPARINLSNYRPALVEQFKGICQICKKEDKKCEVAHIKARAKGGSNELENLTILCKECNVKIGTKNIITYMTEKNIAMTTELSDLVKKLYAQQDLLSE